MAVLCGLELWEGSQLAIVWRCADSASQPLWYIHLWAQWLRKGDKWRRGVAVTSFGVSTKLLYVGPG